jgi:hypothetical protein
MIYPATNLIFLTLSKKQSRIKGGIVSRLVKLTQRDNLLVVLIVTYAFSAAVWGFMVYSETYNRVIWGSAKVHITK